MADRSAVSFLNSDPAMILLFLRWLTLVGVDAERLQFRLNIHESADVAAAEAFWAEVVGVPVDVFDRTTLKRHNPRTVRKEHQRRLPRLPLCFRPP